mmetsp:Transcript_36870/g.57659  ORF Transcript_36870/g.57659 Transcript_36870/m.57659 type:complete len:353 (-) Transcript_36870:395-1453(-)|eukprot:CAMPEP_0184319258 /NCGR_PEP_ID=MMETSP1049-20130417/107337_1 /TAXON_ID=77928 /ORGANISM="Proteomonas sulcata, Strain CCMP704" /LENGTH=352 /DNA_ID=CAMNT_0026639319 /DNA_START=87 /DNA_END=1145 /DNA_ORIENTATION=-
MNWGNCSGICLRIRILLLGCTLACSSAVIGPEAWIECIRVPLNVPQAGSLNRFGFALPRPKMFGCSGATSPPYWWCDKTKEYRLPRVFLIRESSARMQCLGGSSETSPKAFESKKPEQQKPSTAVDRRIRVRSFTKRLPEPEDSERQVLQDVAVILVGTKMPVTVGMVARACASFEVGNIIFVAPRAKDGNILARSAIRASKGALQHSNGQGLNWKVCDSLEDAMGDDVGTVVAMTRLSEDDRQTLFSAHPPLVYSSQLELRGVPPKRREYQGLKELSAEHMKHRQEQPEAKFVLVFGREDVGFLAGELAHPKLEAVCAIPMSSRQGTESLSLSQAVPCVLSRLYEDSLEQA